MATATITNKFNTTVILEAVETTRDYEGVTYPAIDGTDETGAKLYEPWILDKTDKVIWS